MNATVNSNRKLVAKIRNEGKRKGLVESGDIGHLSLWNMLCEYLPKEAFENPDTISWAEMLSMPITKTA